MTLTTNGGHVSDQPVPKGLAGVQRQKYLSLTPEQQRVYRYHFVACGRFASQAYELTVNGVPESWGDFSIPEDWE